MNAAIEQREVSRAARRRRAAFLRERIAVNLRELMLARVKVWRLETSLAIGGVLAGRKAAKQCAALLEQRERAEALALSRQGLIADIRQYSPEYDPNIEARSTLSRFGLAGLVRLEPLGDLDELLREIAREGNTACSHD